MKCPARGAGPPEASADERRVRRVPRGAAHRRHLRHDRGAASAASRRRSRLVQPRPGPARDRRAAGRAAARATRSASPSTIRSTRRSPACGSCARRSPRSTTGSTAAACRRSTRAENVCVSGGGRAALTRAAASLGHINLGHFLPDYTAYEELLDIFQAFTAIPILLEGERGYAFSADDLRREILGPRPLGAPRCRTRATRPASSSAARSSQRWVRDRARARLHAAPRRVLLALRLSRDARARCRSRAPRATSRTSIAIRSCIFDGLTKNWRYPGWRVTWTRRPAARSIDALASAGSFLDGGGSQAAAARGDPAARRRARRSQETRAIQRRRSARSATACSRGLERLGVRFDRVPDGTFYVWGNVADLPPPLNDGMGFFRAALEQQGHHRAGRVLRREPGQAPPRPRLALPQLRALLVRPVGGVARARARAPRRARQEPAAAPTATSART